MQNWQALLLAAVGLLILTGLIWGAVRRHRERRQRDFTRRLETLLQPKETVRVICPQRKSRCILTSSRIIFEEKGHFTAFPLKRIQRVQGKNSEGNRTTVPANMVTMTVKLEEDVLLSNTGADFQELAAQLQAIVKKQNEKKKAKKT